MRFARVQGIYRLLLLFVLAAQSAESQVSGTTIPPASKEQEDSSSTLHVYVELMQIPVLVLNSFRTPTGPVQPADFRVKLQNIATFIPAHVRLEGEDPISLSILLDNGSVAETLWKQLPLGAAMLSRSLRPWDTVNLYTIDSCQLHQIGRELKPDEAVLERSFAAALSIPPFRRSGAKPCASPISLWSAMLYAADQLRSAKGRKVILVLSNGRKAADTDVMERLRHFLTDESISVFNLWHGSGENGPYSLRLDDGRIVSSTSFISRVPFFNAVATVDWAGYALGTEAELSGGMMQSVAMGGVPQALSQVISRVRGRYILEFPKPPGLLPGQGNISVSVRGKDHFIRPAGITLPIRDHKDENFAPPRSKAQ